MKKQINTIEIELEGPVRQDIGTKILREIHDLFYSVKIKIIKEEIVEDNYLP